jgi:uncharacterized protein (TIGR03066 family)
MRIAYLTALVSVLALGLLLAPARADDKKGDKPKDLIVGKWVPEKVEKGQEGSLEFTKDGKIVAKFTADGKTIEFGGTYKFTADDKMEIELEFMGQKKKETLTVKVTKDELITTDEKDKKETFKRAK